MKTIKARLTFLLVLLCISFLGLGYEVSRMSSDAQATATRLVLIGKIDSENLTFAMEVRGYQLYAKAATLEAYKASYERVLSHIDALKALLISRTNQEKITQLRNDMEALHAINAPRFALV